MADKKYPILPEKLRGKISGFLLKGLNDDEIIKQVRQEAQAYVGDDETQLRRCIRGIKASNTRVSRLNREQSHNKDSRENKHHKSIESLRNQFILSDNDLKTLLDGYKAWYQGNKNEKDYALKQEKNAEEIKSKFLNKTYLDKTPDEQFIQDILSYFKTVEGPVNIKIGQTRITNELENIKRNLVYLIDSSDDPFKMAAKILQGEYKIKYFSKAFWTPIFQAQYPKLLPNWNNKTEIFLKKVGIDLKTSKLTEQQKYESISDAFLYLQKIDPSQSFHNINHLMHYGTVIDEGNELIERLINNNWGSNGNDKDLAQKIADIQKVHITEKRIAIRKDAEEKAKKLLELKKYNFGENDLREFFKFLNHDYWGGKQRHNRFGMAYTGSNVNALVEQLDAVNEWIERFWTASQDKLFGIIEEYYNQRPIRNAGTAFPSLILYLRNPSEYNLCFKRMVQGLSTLIDFSEKGYNGSFYIKYNDKLNGLKKDFKLLPQEMDIILTVITGNGPKTNQVYTLTECAEETGLSEDFLKSWVRGIERKKQAVIYGPPGTGKTFLARRLARHLVSEGDGFVELVQFHSAYAYEDFIQGIRPETREDGGLEYRLVPGKFIDFCRKAETRDGICVLIIDEINRANLTRVFGELMYLLEYREESIPLAGGSTLRIPENVRVIGTMNTADRSIALVDHALRRRFAFLPLYPDYEILKYFHERNDTGFDATGLINILNKLNKQIGEPNYEIGPSFFLIENIEDQLADIWRMEIEPYLEEYFFDQTAKVGEFRWEKIKGDIMP